MEGTHLADTSKGSGCLKEAASLPPDWDEGAPEGWGPTGCGACCGVTSTSEGGRRTPEVSRPGRARPKGASLTMAPSCSPPGAPRQLAVPHAPPSLVPQTSAPSRRVSFPFVFILLPRPVAQSCSPSAGLSYHRPSVFAAHFCKPRPRTLQTLKLNVSRRISLSAPYPTKSLAHVD